MVYDIILSQDNSQFVARVRQWPDVVATGKTRDDVLRQVKKRLQEYLTHRVEVVQIEIDLPDKNKNPWLEQFGRFQEDPTFDDLIAEIAAYRHSLDSQA
jgi:predicted RNase H-like HicB family nuclease